MKIFQLLLLKRKLEDIIIRIFIKFGRDLASKNPLQEDYEIYFLFPFYHTGGAEKVHACLAAAFRDKKCVVLFTRKSHDDGFKAAFQKTGHRILDISAYTDNKKTYWKNLIWRGLISAHINGQKKKPLIINGQCNFAYKLSPWIKKEIPQIELIHSFNSFSEIRIPFIQFYQHTVMISRKAISDHEEQYQRLGIPAKYKKNISYIANGVEIPATIPARNTEERNLKILYAGRATPEKRVEIVAKIAAKAIEQKLPAEFGFAGDIKTHLEPALQNVGEFYGMQSDENAMKKLYAEHDALIITSSEEGFPMVIMEAMAHGCIIIATPVGDIPNNLKQGINGFIFRSVTDETEIINEAIHYISIMINENHVRKIMAENNYEYALKHFSIRAFEQKWQALAENLNSAI